MIGRTGLVVVCTLIAGCSLYQGKSSSDDGGPSDAGPDDALDAPDAPDAPPPVPTPASLLTSCLEPFTSLVFPATAINGPPVTSHVAIASTGPVGFVVTASIVGDPSFSVQSVCVVYDSTLPCSIEVVFAPSSVGTKTATITLVANATSIGYEPTTFEIPVTGEALPAAIGVVGPPRFAFTLEKGRMPADIEITNTTSGTVDLGLPTTIGEFEIVSTTCQPDLEAGASCIMRVQRDVRTPGCHAGSLSIPSTAGTVEVPLEGAPLISKLTVQVFGPGTVTASGASAINCGTGCSSYRIPAGTSVTLTTQTSTAFGGWNLAECGMSPTCTFTVTEDEVQATANFVPSLPAPVTLDLTIEGNGEVVLYDDLGIDVVCRASCMVPMGGIGQARLLVASFHDALASWGGGCNDAPYCYLGGLASHSLVATFEPDPGSMVLRPDLPSASSVDVHATGDLIVGGGGFVARLLPSGVTVWKRPFADTIIDVIASGSTIYVLGTSNLYALSDTGSVAWRVALTGMPCATSNTRAFRRNLAVTAAGDLAVVFADRLRVFDAAGTERWSVTAPACSEVAASTDLIAVTRPGVIGGEYRIRRYTYAGDLVLGPDLIIPGSGLAAMTIDPQGRFVTTSVETVASIVPGAIVFEESTMQNTQPVTFGLVTTASAAVVVAHSGSYDGINEGLPAVLQVFTPAGARILRFARGSVPPGAAFYSTPSGFGVRFADMAVRGNRVVVVGSGSLAGRGVFETAPWIELLDIP